MESWRSSAQRAISSSAVVLGIVGAVILYRFDPTVYGFYPPCVFRMITGLQCPGCGSTRALYHLLHGDVAGAFRLNAMLFAVAPFSAAAGLSRRFRTHPVTGWAVAAAVVGWSVWRNL